MPGADFLAGLEFRNPALLWFALLVPAAFFLRARRGEAAIPFAPAFFIGQPGFPRAFRVRLQLLPRVLQALGLLVLVFAAARPVRPVEEPRRIEGIEIALVLDISSSMNAKDLDPAQTRLEVAKAAAARFIAARPEDRIGLLTFARYPDLRSPPTADHRALQEILTGVTTIDRESPEDATGIGTAVARAVQVLRTGRSPARVVLLLTDGDENVAAGESPQEIAPMHAAQLAADQGVRVHAIAAGSPDGEPGRGPVDPGAIRRLAERSGGAFFSAPDAAALAGVFGAIDRLEKFVFADPKLVLEERFLPFLVAGLVLWLLGRLLAASLFEVLP